MGERKAVFFDIDGTLVDAQNVVGPGNRKALAALQERGHLTFLCTGRSRAYIREPSLISLPLDGSVSACGAMIEYHGETLLKALVDEELAAFTVDTVRACNCRVILEGEDYLYLDREEFMDDPYGQKLFAEIDPYIRPIDACRGHYRMLKLSVATEEADMARLQDVLSPYYDFKIHSDTVAELVPKGYNKGTGLRWICERLGIPIEDTYAFGDSPNDEDMMRSVGFGIAMGNGHERIKAMADLVTDPIEEAGILKALRKLGLIDPSL